MGPRLGRTKTAVGTIFVGKDRAYNRRPARQRRANHSMAALGRRADVRTLPCRSVVIVARPNGATMMTLHTCLGLGEGASREPGGRNPAAVLRAAPEVQILC